MTLILLMLLNVLDAVATLVSIHLGGTVEINPLMRYAMSCGTTTFLVVKVSLGSIGVAVLHWGRSYQWVPRISTAITVLYGLVVAWDLYTIAAQLIP